MCGIVGSIYKQTGDQEERKKNLLIMLQTIAHRGPDGSYYWNDENCYLGFNYLAIIGGKKATQPLHNENKEIYLVCNGEIYNHQKIIKQLVQIGHKFTSKSDCEVIIHLYEEKGVKCLKDLKGQFAFVLLDQKKKIAFAARDRFGICPLFYKIDNKSILFASEIKAILANKTVDAELDLQGLAETVFFYGTILPRTCFYNVKQLPPGTYLLIDIDNWSNLTKTYWKLNFSDKRQEEIGERISTEEVTNRFKHLLIKSVKRRLQGKFAPAVYLSGGIDSSTISTICHQFSSGSTVFSLQFADKQFDESEFQVLVRNRVKFRHKVAKISVKQIYENLVSAIWHAETPLTRTAPVPMMLLSHLVRHSGYKCVLSGEGADELLAGYSVFAKGKASIEDKYYLNKRLLTLFKDELFIKENIEKSFQQLIKHRNNDLHQLQKLEVKTKLSQYLLHSQGERMSMANAVELRFPYLDEDLVYFIELLPAKYYFNNKEGKQLLRQAMQNELPNEIIQRKKQGYLAPNGFNPISETFFYNKSKLPKYIQEMISDDMVKRVGIFKPKLVQKVIKETIQNRKFTETAFLLVLTTHLLHWLFIARKGR